MQLYFMNGVMDVSRSELGDLQSHYQYDVGQWTLRLPDDKACSTPLRIHHVCDQPVSIETKREIYVGEHSALVVYESFEGPTDLAYQTAVQTQIRLSPSARLSWYKQQSEGALSSHHAKMDIAQTAASRFGYYLVSAGGLEVTEFSDHQLVEGGAESEVVCFFRAEQQQQQQLFCQMRHQASNTMSQQFFKGIVDDAASTHFVGRVVVDPNIHNVEAHQRNNNLLLSSTAQAKTQPELKIDSDDVQCSHGATIGALDDDALFFLQSRGISEAAGRALLTSGFSNEIFSRFPNRQLALTMGGAHGYGRES